MIGLFDSGAGGINTLSELKRLLPKESFMLLCDYEHAPYGEKTQEELVPIIEKGLCRLRAAGADRVLIACCTASAHHSLLSRESRELSLPVIAPTARAALRESKNGRIAVLATRLTVSTHAFRDSLGGASVTELAAGELVRAAEGELSESEISSVIEEVTDRAADLGADTLILGCTHFHSFIDRIAPVARKKNIEKIISSAREGALELAGILKKN
jgi:glutamate racemase